MKLKNMPPLFDRSSRVYQCARGICRLAACFTLFATASCATSWKESGLYYRTTQTIAQIESAPGGRVKVDNQYIGETPLEIPLQYKQQVTISKRRVSYWITQPGWSLLVTILSLGTYLPFSAIPVDDQSTLEPVRNFRDSDFEISIVADGYPEWRQSLHLSGEPTVRVQARLGGPGEVGRARELPSIDRKIIEIIQLSAKEKYDE